MSSTMMASCVNVPASDSHRKSAISYSGRISISLGPGMGLGQRFTQANRLVDVLDFPEPEAGDQLAGLGERTVDDRTAGTIERNTLALRGGLEAVGDEHDAGIAQLIIEFAHRLHRLHGLCRGRKPFSLSSVAFTSTITRIVCLLALAGLIGLASERRTAFSEADFVLQIF
jgi:hypothetical protein